MKETVKVYLILGLIITFGACSFSFEKSKNEANSLTKENVLVTLSKVNDKWQKEHDAASQNAFWHPVAYHTGNMAAYQSTKNQSYLSYTLEWAENNQWSGDYVTLSVDGLTVTGDFIYSHGGWPIPREWQFQTERDVIDNHVFLKLRNMNNTVDMYYSKDRKNWTKIKNSVEVSAFHHNVLSDFSSLRIGLVSMGDGKVRFKNFKYEPIKQIIL